jgi:uncharacterized lipoprotein YajG
MNTKPHEVKNGVRKTFVPLVTLVVAILLLSGCATPPVRQTITLDLPPVEYQQ